MSKDIRRDLAGRVPQYVDYSDPRDLGLDIFPSRSVVRGKHLVSWVYLGVRLVGEKGIRQ